MRAAQDGDQV